jgi:uncharacterized protein
VAAPADWRDAVEPVAGGGAVRLKVEATPGARDARFPDGFNPWRDGRIGVRVREAAVDGQANAAIVAAVADALGVAASRVHLEAGAADRRKTLRVDGLERAAVLAWLEARL